MAPEAEYHTVQLANQRVSVRMQGPKDSRPLLFLNGLGAPLELWDPLLRRLRGVRTIAFDAPGSGGSQAPAFPLSIGGHARLALSLLDHLGCQEADVIGLSFGGMVAQELAHHAPARVRRLILASTSCGWGSIPGSPAALMTVTSPERYYSRATFEAVAPWYIGGKESADEEFVRQQARVRATHPPNAWGYMYQVWAAASWSSLCWLSSLTHPALVLGGQHDPLVPPCNADLLTALLPHGRKYIVARGGHLCLLEQAAQLAPMVRQFLERPGAGSASPSTRSPNGRRSALQVV